MKKLLAVFAFLLIGAVSYAQQQPKIPTAEELAKKNMDEMDERLKLSATQKSIIYNYAYDLAKSQVELFKKQQSGNFQNEDGTAYFRAVNITNNKIKGVLQPEQISAYNTLIEDRVNGNIDDKRKKKKKKKGEEEEVVVGIEGLKMEGEARP